MEDSTNQMGGPAQDATQRASPHGPRPVQPLPRGHRGIHPAGAGPPRRRLPRSARRDLRTSAIRLPHRQRPHVPRLGNGLGRHGGGVRERGFRGRRRRGGSQRRVRRAHVRRRGPVRCAGRASGRRVGIASGSSARPGCPPGSGGDRRRPRGNLYRRAQRPGRAGRSQGRRPPARRLRHVARRHRCAHRRMGRGHRLQRNPEVPRGSARTGPHQRLTPRGGADAAAGPGPGTSTWA